MAGVIAEVNAIAHVGPRRGRLPACLLDLKGEGFGRSRAAGIVDDDMKATAGKTFGDGRADTARSSCDNGGSLAWHSTSSGCGRRCSDPRTQQISARVSG
jgi:hypothetical protein